VIDATLTNNRLLFRTTLIKCFMPNCLILKLAVWCLYPAYKVSILNDATTLTLANNRLLLIRVMKWILKLTGLSMSCLQNLSTEQYCDLDLCPWKAVGIFLSSWWSNVLSCMILNLTLWSLSCQQGFNTNSCYRIDLWPLTLTKNVFFVRSWRSCTNWYDPVAYGSVFILPTR
jgi:hypothetical protein